MSRYFAAAGSPFTDKDAEVIGPELEALARSGSSSPQEIVEYADTHDTPLRVYLQMDRPLDEVAQSWYRHRARQMAASIMVRVKTEKGMREIRAFHSILFITSENESTTRRYVTIEQVRSSEAMAEQVISEALEKMNRWRAKYWLYREVLIKRQPALAAIFDVDP